MIVTRAKAEEAHTILRSRYMGEIDGLPLEFDKLDKHVLQALYYSAAKATHPDGGDGNAEAFARVDWAKHVLLKWLEKPTNAEQRSELGGKCAHCDGRGYVRKQVGFKLGARIQCVRCAGTGDAGHEPDRPQGEY